jgi:hypothetical protein
MEETTPHFSKGHFREVDSSAHSKNIIDDPLASPVAEVDYQLPDEPQISIPPDKIKEVGYDYCLPDKDFYLHKIVVYETKMVIY